MRFTGLKGTRRLRRWRVERIGSPREILSLHQWGRFLVDRFFVVPLGGRLPLGIGLRIADFVGMVDAIIPSHEARTIRREMEGASGLSGKASLHAAGRRLAVARRALVISARIQRGQERAEDWSVTEEGGESARRLLSEGQSLVLVGGHFSDSASSFRYKILPVDNSSVGGEQPKWRLSPFHLQRRLETQLSSGRKEKLFGLKRNPVPRVPDVWHLNPDWSQRPRHSDVQEALINSLGTPGSTVRVLVDAYWEKPNAYRRPFAGMADRGFALGAARIARKSRCPVVPMVPVHGPEPRSVVLVWGEPIEPAESAEGDPAVLDTALTFIERCIARFPTQYLHPIGTDRVWSPPLQRWVDRR